MTKKEAIDKIRKCLALANSPNKQEAKAAKERAEVLIEKYKISDDMLKSYKINKSVQPIGKVKRPPEYIKSLMSIICNAFGVKTVGSIPTDSNSGIESTIEFIGYGPKADVAGYVFDLLRRRLINQRRRFVFNIDKRKPRPGWISCYRKKTKKAEKTRLGNIWAMGWTIGVQQVIAELAANMQSQSCEDEAKALRTYINKEYPNIKTDRSEKHDRTVVVIMGAGNGISIPGAIARLFGKTSSNYKNIYDLETAAKAADIPSHVRDRLCDINIDDEVMAKGVWQGTKQVIDLGIYSKSAAIELPEAGNER